MTDEEILQFITDAIRAGWALVELSTFFVRLVRDGDKMLVAVNQDT